MDTRYSSKNSEPDKLIPFSDALAYLGISRSTAYRLLESGELPSPVKIGARNFFSARELQAWISERLAERDGQPATALHQTRQTARRSVRTPAPNIAATEDKNERSAS